MCFGLLGFREASGSQIGISDTLEAVRIFTSLAVFPEGNPWGHGIHPVYGKPVWQALEGHFSLILATVSCRLGNPAITGLDTVPGAVEHLSNRTRKDNRWLRRGLCQSASAAMRQHHCSLSAFFDRKAAKCGGRKSRHCHRRTIFW
jgi:hypothetical protein